MLTEKFNKAFDRLLLPFFILIVLLFSLSSIYNLTLQLHDLVKVEGQVRMIRIEEDRGFRKRTTYDFFVYLENGSRYRIMDDELFEINRDKIREEVNKGDQVTIFRRTQYQTNFGSGTTDMIYQLEHDGQVLMPITIMHRNFKHLLIFELLILLGLTTAQIYKMKKRAKDNI